MAADPPPKLTVLENWVKFFLESEYTQSPTLLLMFHLCCHASGPSVSGIVEEEGAIINEVNCVSGHVAECFPGLGLFTPHSNPINVVLPSFHR